MKKAEISRDMELEKLEINGETIEIQGNAAVINIYYMPGFPFERLQKEEVENINLVYPEECSGEISREEFDALEPMDKFQAIFNVHTISPEEFYSPKCRQCNCALLKE
jgi:hypothetical protein